MRSGLRHSHPEEGEDSPRRARRATEKRRGFRVREWGLAAFPNPEPRTPDFSPPYYQTACLALPDTGERMTLWLCQLRVLSRLVLVGLLGGLSGCGGYVLKGRVVEGAGGDMTFVAPDDPRLAEPGLPDARITVERDPGRLSAHVAASGLSDLDGRFAVALDAFGAGWMDERWRIEAIKSGFARTSSVKRLDSATRDMRLLIILAPGFSEAREDLLQQLQRLQSSP